jgi:hypothetical protein
VFNSADPHGTSSAMWHLSSSDRDESLVARENLQSLTFQSDDDKFAAAKWFDQRTSLS